MIENSYYLAHGETHRLCMDYYLAHRAARIALEAWRVENGAAAYFLHSMGLKFNGVVPFGWKTRKTKNPHRMSVPDPRTAEGRDVIARWPKVGAPRAEKLWDAVFAGNIEVRASDDGLHRQHFNFHVVGDKVYLWTKPPWLDLEIPGATRVPASAYALAVEALKLPACADPGAAV